MIAQIEGGVLFGISGALRERVEIKSGEVQQSYCYGYEVLRLYQNPEVFVDILDSNEARHIGGKLGVTTVAPAIANGFAAITERLLRHMPYIPSRALDALAS